jgi:hypothetical protein
MDEWGYEMSYAEIWKTLSTVDCSKHIEKKGNLSYLSWAWAWGTLMDHYPQATYKVHKERHAPDGTVECRVTLTIDDCSRMMWLPVMDNKNNAIKNPDLRKISDTRMRCLVKVCALFGLGHYIYAGEDLPQEPSVEITSELVTTFNTILEGDDALALLDFQADVGADVMNALFNKAPYGQKTALKESVRLLERKAHETLDDYANQIITLSEAADPACLELVSELTATQKKMVWARLSDVHKDLVKTLSKEVA